MKNNNSELPGPGGSAGLGMRKTKEVFDRVVVLKQELGGIK